MTRYEHFWRPSHYEIISHPGFIQGIASTLHSSFRVPAWELLQWKMARQHSYKPTTYRLELVCAREQNKQRLKLVTSQKLESSGF